MKWIICLIGYCMLLLPSFAQSRPTAVDNSWYHDKTVREYVLGSAEQLMGLSKLVAEGENFAGKIIVLQNDINVTSYVWHPIGTREHPFAGILDGAGCMVSIGKIYPGELGGMFGVLSGGTIRNLSVSIVEEQESVDTIGGITALADLGSTIEYCVHVDTLSARNAVVMGGIAGLSEGKVSSCCNNGGLSNKNENENVLGGIVGISSGVVVGSHNKAFVSGTNICGGIIGKGDQTHGHSQVHGCSNEGKVYVESTDEKNTDAMAGGIAGRADGVEMTECCNTAVVSAYCYKNRNRAISSYAYAGGLIGVGYGAISASYNIGEVASRCVAETSGVVDGVAYVYSGGLIGYNRDNAMSTLSYSYNAEYIYAFGYGKNGTSLNYGGVVGDFAAFMPRMKCCYYIEGDGHGEGIGEGTSFLHRDVGVQVSSLQLQTPDFLHSGNRNVLGLNDNNSFVFDSARKNKGFPVLNKVQTIGFSRMTDNVLLLKGKTAMSGQKGFYYWIAGLEDYVAEIEADTDFEYQLKGIQQGQDCFFQAFVKRPDGTVAKGEVVRFRLSASASNQSIRK